MASDSIAERRQAFNDALDVLNPQIKGVRNKLNDDVSAGLKAALAARLAFLQDRFNKLQASLITQDSADAAVATLEEDGFPDLPDLQIPEALFVELQVEGVADDAAAGGFEAMPRATTISIDLGVVANKP